MTAPLVADAVKSSHVRPGATAAASRNFSQKIWIDLENTPHIRFPSPSSANWTNAAHGSADRPRRVPSVRVGGTSLDGYKKIGAFTTARTAPQGVGPRLSQLQLLGFVLKERPIMD